MLVAESELEQARRLLQPICESFDDEYPLEALAAARQLLETTLNPQRKRRGSTPRA